MMRATAALVVLSAVVGCRSLPTVPPPAATSVPALEEAVQVFHRRARSETGQLHSTALGALADAAVATVAPGQLPFDGWASLASETEQPVVVGAPRPGTMAEEIARRWRAASPGRGVILLDAEGVPPDPFESAALVLVVAPHWAGRGASPDPTDLVAAFRGAGWPPPRLIVVDLLEPLIEADAWTADMIVAGSDPLRIGLATEYILSARANGAIPDLRDLAGRRSAVEGDLSWTVQALVD